MKKFTHLRVGDTVVRMLGGEQPMHLTVTGLEKGRIQCGDWEFDPETGIEIDDLLEWGPAYGKTGSYLT